MNELRQQLINEVLPRSGRPLARLFSRLRSMSLLNVMLLIVFTITPLKALSMSEENEIKLGAKEHQKIIAQYGIYRDKDLQDYVSMVGQRVAAQSSRPNLEYHFTLLDDEIINAFALPGGYVYVTQGHAYACEH